MKETQFGEESEQAKICKEIMNKTGEGTCVVAQFFDACPNAGLNFNLLAQVQPKIKTQLDQTNSNRTAFITICNDRNILLKFRRKIS